MQAQLAVVVNQSESRAAMLREAEEKCARLAEEVDEQKTKVLNLQKETERMQREVAAKARQVEDEEGKRGAVEEQLKETRDALDRAKTSAHRAAKELREKEEGMALRLEEVLQVRPTP